MVVLAGLTCMMIVAKSQAGETPAPRGEAAGAPIKTLLITGYNNHNWAYTSRLHKDTLEATGRFVVDVTDTPDKTLADAAAISSYQLFVLDYNDYSGPKRWSEPGGAAEKNFVAAVRGGAGVLAIHSANNAFKGWAEYEQMLGLMWREGAGHGKFHEFTVKVTDKQHPVTSGLSDFATTDELYHKLTNTQKANYRLLAQAFDAREIGGTGENEPMAITLEFGKGRVFATPLGHVWKDAEETKVSIINPAFRAMITRAGEWAATGEVTLPATWGDVRKHNELTEGEKAAGWRLLFDGKTTGNWKGFKQPAFPQKGWIVKDGTLTHARQGGGGDLCTTEEFSDFEFQCDWRVEKGGNSGVMYRCAEDKTYPWETGPEMQILDDANHADGKKPKTRAGTLYDIYACAFDVSRPAGEWNTAKVVAKGDRIEHWLNGFKVVETVLWSEEFKAAHGASKWPGMPDYAKRAKGRIALQDHGDEVSFRNVKIRELK